MKPGRRAALGRGVRIVLALVLGALVSCGAASCGGRPGPAADPLALVRSDRRIAELLEPCVHNGFYDRDLSDPVPYLIEKLERGRPEPLKRAKEELGQLGERSVEALTRFFDRNYADAMRAPYAENAVDAAAFSRTDAAHELLLRAFLHPHESLRSKALDGLRQQARPGDFDLLRDRLPGETGQMRRAIVGALFAIDAARAESLFLDWIARGEERALWALAGANFPVSRREDSARRSAELFAQLEPPLAVQLAASAARTGDGPALGYLRSELQGEDLSRRVAAVTAAGAAGLADELEKPLLEDPSDEVRALAAGWIAAAGELVGARATWLRSALDDQSLVVQGEALRLLCKSGDEEALVRALAQLQGETGFLQNALQALREPVKRDRALAVRAFERLQERHRLEEHRPVQQRTATFKAIGLLPLREAAVFLRTLGVAAEGQRIESLRAHEWLMIQGANTGQEGRRFLYEELPREDDPLRRLDLLDAVGSNRDELARSALLAFVEDGARTPYERLFGASLAAKVGPSWEVAPRLKRACYGMQDASEIEARVALQCLLWFWY